MYGESLILSENEIDDLAKLMSRKDIQSLISGSKEADDFINSTHPCFITFNSSHSIISADYKYFLKSMKHLVFARILFFHVYTGSPGVGSAYLIFLEKYFEEIARIPNLAMLQRVLLKHYKAKHFFLAVDELKYVEMSYNDIVRKKEKSAAPSKYSTSFINDMLLEIGQTVIQEPSFSAILSSLVTSPFGKYVNMSMHPPILVALETFVNELPSIQKLILHRRGNPKYNEGPVRRMLLSTGGHPKLLSDMTRWLSKKDVTYEDMNYDNASIHCLVNHPNFSEPRLTYGILTGKLVDVDVAFGLGGILSRPVDFEDPSVVIASPLVLHTVAMRFVFKNSLTINCNNLVPSEIKDGKSFELFFASWLALRLHMGDSLQVILNPGEHRCASLQSQLGIPVSAMATSPSSSTFANLPNTLGDSIYFDPNIPDSLDSSFGFSDKRNCMKILLPKDPNNPGFDIIIGNAAEKKILLVQLKTRLVTTAERGGEGAKIHKATLVDCIKNSAKATKKFFGENWDVSLLVVTANETSKIGNLEESEFPDEFTKRISRNSRLIDRAGLYNLLGCSFAVCLHLALGETHKFPTLPLKESDVGGEFIETAKKTVKKAR